MKKLIYIFICFVLISYGIEAQNVSREKAIEIAKSNNYFFETTGDGKGWEYDILYGEGYERTGMSWTIQSWKKAESIFLRNKAKWMTIAIDASTGEVIEKYKGISNIKNGDIKYYMDFTAKKKFNKNKYPKIYVSKVDMIVLLTDSTYVSCDKTENNTHVCCFTFPYMVNHDTLKTSTTVTLGDIQAYDKYKLYKIKGKRILLLNSSDVDSKNKKFKRKRRIHIYFSYTSGIRKK